MTINNSYVYSIAVFICIVQDLYLGKMLFVLSFLLLLTLFHLVSFFAFKGKIHNIKSSITETKSQIESQELKIESISLKVLKNTYSEGLRLSAEKLNMHEIRPSNIKIISINNLIGNQSEKKISVIAA